MPDRDRAAGGVLRVARGLSWLDWWTLAEATAWLALARLAILLLNFRVLSRRLGVAMHESPLADDERRRPLLRRMRWAIDAVSRRVPWRCMCLERGVAATMMLRTRGIDSTFYLGVAREADGGPVRAHAWVRCGTYFVTGGEDHSRFAVVSTFAAGARP
jgi:hypothetical protein